MSRASASAIAAVEAAGGRVVTRYLTPLGVRATLKPDRFASPLRTPAPPPREMRYYLQAKNRGYLSVEVQVAEVRRRLAAGAPPAVAAAIMPVFTGGAPYDARRHLVDIQLDAPQLVAAAAAADAAKAAAAAAAGAEAGAGGGGTKRAD